MAAAEVLVVIPVYNARPYLKAAIESILAQTYENFTLLIINDGSTDGSEEDVKAFQDKRIVLRQQANKGPGAAMNLGIQYALENRINYLARMDADDISLPYRIDTQIRLLEKFPAAAACSANCHYIHAITGQIIGTSTVSTSPELIRWEINNGLRGLIQGVTIFRVQPLVNIGGYRNAFKRAEEVDVFLRLAEKYELRNSPEYLYDIRIRQDSYSIQNTKLNIHYQFYALDCANKRHASLPESSFDAFHKSLSLFQKYYIWREELLLRSWRSYVHNHNLTRILLAVLMDPKRLVVRLLRSYLH